MVKLKDRKKILRDPDAGKAIKQLSTLIRDMRLAEKKLAPLLGGLHDHFKISGTNLVHYLVLRSNEIRELQEYLHTRGLSSLTNLESHTLYQVQNVLRWLKGNEINMAHKSLCDFEQANRLQEMHTAHLLGEFPSRDRPHIMVTFSPEMTNDRKLIEEMLLEGMSVARINCAHDDPAVWTKMIHTLRQAIAKSGKSCKIYMDIAGPKIRIKSIHANKPKQDEALPVSEGKELILTGALKSIEKLRRDNKKARDIITIQPKELITMMKAGERIFFDDGKFEAQVIKEKTDYVIVRIVRINPFCFILSCIKGRSLFFLLEKVFMSPAGRWAILLRHPN